MHVAHGLIRQLDLAGQLGGMGQSYSGPAWSYDSTVLARRRPAAVNAAIRAPPVRCHIGADQRSRVIDRFKGIASREMYSATNRFVATASGQVASTMPAPVASSGYAAPRQVVTRLWSAVALDASVASWAPGGVPWTKFSPYKRVFSASLYGEATLNRAGELLSRLVARHVF
jgi:hypothetical protein